DPEVCRGHFYENGFSVGSAANHNAFGNKNFTLFSNTYGFLNIPGKLQNFFRNKGNGCFGTQGYLRLAGIDGNGEAFGIHSRNYTGHSGPGDGYIRDSGFRAYKCDHFFFGKIITGIKVEIPADEQLTVFRFFIPDRQRRTSHQHKILTSVPYVARTVQVKIPLKLRCDKIIPVSRILRKSINLCLKIISYMTVQI